MEPRPCGRGNFMPILTRGWQFSCFNGATTLRSWKPPHHSPMVGLNAHGFNGATTLRSWKLDIRVQGIHDHCASMEPRPCGRGNNQSPPAAAASRLVLQWSHDLAVVETRRRPGRRTGPRSFNGATTLRSWKRFNRNGHPHGWGGLQWSHDLAVVETDACRGGRRGWSGFNGATTLRSWKPGNSARTGRSN